MRTRLGGRIGLRVQIAGAIALVTAGAVLAVGLVTRWALAGAFDDYLATMPHTNGASPGRGMGRAMLGAAEQTFLSTVDQAVLWGAAIAALVATVVAVVLAARIARPIRSLESAAESLAAGDRENRVEPEGPEEIAALGEAFNRMAESLSTSESLRRRMVADIAHELRNPLAAARLHAEGVAEGVFAPDAARMEAINQNLVHLTALVNDLQELSLAEAGGLRYEMVRLDLGRLVRSEVELFADTVSDQVAVSYEGASGATVVEGDERRISQVVRNLLSNAQRHTPTGAIAVAVATLPDGRVEVAVSDSGEGIPAADLPHVFERFYRADKARAADTGGAGLGLAIVKSIVESHHGEVFARPSHIGGATVGFRLPLA